MFDDLSNLHDDILNDSSNLLSHDNALDTGQTFNHDVFHDSSGIYDYSDDTHAQHDTSGVSYCNSFDSNSSSDIYNSPDDSIVRHASFHSDSDSNIVYHEHSGTVYHEHYWEKQRYLDMSGNGEPYGNNLSVTSSPVPENQSCVDNNNDGQCDSSSGSDSD